MEAPAQLVPRVAKETCTLVGVEIKKDMPVFLALASGNRDSDVFENADQFHENRDQSALLTFGQGRHRCIGEPLGMAQICALTKHLVQDNVKPLNSKTSYQSRIGHRWPQKLIVKKH